MTLLLILPNFNPLRTLEVILFLLLFPRIYGRHYLILFQGLVANWRKLRHICKNTSRVEIIIIISIENRIKSNTNFGHVLRAIFYTYCYHTLIIIPLLTFTLLYLVNLSGFSRAEKRVRDFFAKFLTADLVEMVTDKVLIPSPKN